MTKKNDALPSSLLSVLSTLTSRYDDEFFEPQFVSIVRSPCEVFVSWLALAQAGARMMVGYELPLSTATEAHLDFWDRFQAQETAFFAEPDHHHHRQDRWVGRQRGER